MTSDNGSVRALCATLEIERPLLCAPMARIAGGQLAAAVSGAGGLGFLGAGYGDPGWLDEQMAHVPDASDIGIGLITWHMAPTAVDDALVHRPKALWLSFGDPAPHIPKVHDAGAVAVCQVARTAEAVRAAEAGADVIVVQGSEAGGHGRAGRALFGLIPEVVDAVDVPVVAAGGISDVRGFRAATELGAAGVALGTALYATVEANDVEAAKAKLVEVDGDSTIQSRVYDHVRGPLWPDEYVGRSVQTELTEEWAGRETAMESSLDAIRTRYADDVAEANMSRRVLWAGEGVGSIDEIVPARTVVEAFPRLDG